MVNWRSGKFNGTFKREELATILSGLKVHKIENFFGSEFEFYTIPLFVMLKY